MLAKDNEYLEEAAESLYIANADEIVRQQCRAREDAEKRERSLLKGIRRAEEKIAEQEKQLAEKDNQLTEKDNQLTEKDKLIAEHEKEIQALRELLAKQQME